MNPSNFWVTSDLHLGHANIIKYCNRPFSSVDEMDESIIKTWNSQVDPDDAVFHVGDFVIDRRKVTTLDAYVETIVEKYMKRLNGQIIFLPGNHDVKQLTALDKAGKLPDNCSFFTPSTGIFAWRNSATHKTLFMCHYPLDKKRREFLLSTHLASSNDIYLHGHTHNTVPSGRDKEINILSIDIGWDVEYRLFHINEF